MCLPIEEAKSRWKAEGKHENANINVNVNDDGSADALPLKYNQMDQYQTTPFFHLKKKRFAF